MDQEIKDRLDAQDAVLETILASVKKTQKYIMTSVWITILMFALPFLALLFVVPAFLRSYASSLEGLL